MPRAAIVRQLDRPMTLEDVNHRPLREGEIYVKIAACGVCHSDLSVLNGVLPAALPSVLGHEAAGVVLEVGPGVSGVAKEDHVVALWRPACGQCRYCRAGDGHLCRLGDDPTTAAQGRITLADGAAEPEMINQFLGVGGFSDHAILSVNAFVKIDPSVPLDRAALLGCAVITGFGAAVHGAGVKQGDEVAVFGCGGVGLNIIQGARHAGASVVIAIDLDPAKLEMATTFGATHTLDAKNPKLAKAIKEFTTEKLGVNYAFDAVGSVAITEQGYHSLARGGEVISVGIAAAKDAFSIPQAMSVLQEKGVRGSLAGSTGVARMIPELIDLYKAHKLKLDELVTKTYTLDQANEAMDDLRAGRNARGVILM